MKVNNSLKIAVASIILFPIVSSCQKDPSFGGIGEGSIIPVISSEDVVTKAAGQPRGELSWTEKMDDEGLMIQEFVSDNVSQPFERDCMATKGTVVTTDNISTVYGEFGMEGFLDNYTSAGVSLTNGDQYINAGKVKYNSGDWVLTDGGGSPYPWLSGIQYSFWSYAPMSHLGTYAYGSKGSRHSASIAGYVNPLNSSDQNDVLFAYNNRWFDDSNKAETIDINFRHALSTVLFDVSAIKDMTVTKIEIKGAYGKGSCAISGADLADSDVTKAFVWTLDKSSTYTFVMNGAADTFFMVPQTLPAEATLAITLDDSGTQVNLEKSFTTTWLPGKEYKYVLRYDGLEYEFSLENEEDASHVFTNTGSNSDVTVVPVTSERTTISGTTDENWSWVIKSYQVGDGTPVDVNGTSFTDGGGYNVAKDGNNLKITSLARTLSQQGSHAFWTNAGSLSGDTDGSGWSPLDWSTSRATSSAPLDLSKFNFRTESAQAMTTANCYVIRHAGTYKIPLVYGNGIVDGRVNEESYYPNATGGTCRLERFVNHKGFGIISPFIEYNTSDGNPKSQANSYLSPLSGTSGYSVVWQDEADILTINGISKEDVSVVDTDGVSRTYNISYLTFTIPQNKICQNNALIAVKDSDGVMWSWCIWTTNDPALLSSPITVTNYAGNAYQFFPLSAIGYIDGYNYPAKEQVIITLEQKDSGKTIEITVDEPEVHGEASANFYQFGRKDPMCKTPNPTPSGGHDISDGPVDLKTAIRNPGTYYCHYVVEKWGGNWCSTVYNNLWSGKVSTDETDGLLENSTEIIKTVYDPSPVGYKIPAPKAYTGFTTTGTNNDEDPYPDINASGEYINGWNFYTSLGSGNTVNTGGPTIFFPGLGSRYCDNGEIVLDPELGIFWSAIPKNDVSAWDMGIGIHPLSGPLVHTQYQNSRSDGYSVRPVLEDPVSPSPSKIKSWKISEGYDL